MKKPLKAILYGRVSTEDQEKGTSLRDQLAGNRAKAASLGAEIVAEFEDSDSGRYYLTRAGLQSALADLEQGRANVLIAKDLVRLTRNDRVEQATILRRIKEAGAQLVFWDVTYENSAMGEFALNVTGDFAILERAVIRDRTMRGRRRYAMEGVQPARTQAPFGYIIPRRDDIVRGTYPPEQLGKYLLHPERAPIAREIFERYASGQSLHAIAYWLQSQGVPTVGGGRFWRPSNLIVIIQNETYYGEAAFGKRRYITDETRLLRGFKRRDYSVPVPREEWTIIPCPPIVSKELWDRCQKVRQENRARLSTRVRSRLLLTGMIRCPRCRRVASGRGHARTFVSHYKCKESNPGSNSARIACWPKTMNAKKLDALILDVVRTVVQQPEALDAAYERFRSEVTSQVSRQELARLKQQLKELEAEEAATVQAQIAGVRAGASTVVYEGLLREVALKRTALQTRIQQATAAINSVKHMHDKTKVLHQSLKSTLDLLLEADESIVSTSEKNALLATIIDTIYPDESGENYTITFKGFDNSTRVVVQAGLDGRPFQFHIEPME